jgi:hypothetical protein
VDSPLVVFYGPRGAFLSQMPPSGRLPEATRYAGGVSRVPSMYDSLEVQVFPQPDGGEG